MRILRRVQQLLYPSVVRVTGTMKPVIDSEYPLESLQAAHEYMESNASTGKVLIRVV